MLQVIQDMMDGNFEKETFLVKIYPLTENFNPASMLPDNFTFNRVAEKDRFLYADPKLFFYYKNATNPSIMSHSFTLIFRRSEMRAFEPFWVMNLLEVVAYHVNACLVQMTPPLPVDWHTKTGFPFGQN